MTPYDDLLLWASEKGQGSLSSLRDACSWTASAAGARQRGQDVLDDLLALGHLDVAGGRWAVTPTSLGLLADGGGNAVFLGARPRWFVDAMRDLDSASDARLRDLADHVYDYDLVEQRGPGTWFLGVGPEAPLAGLQTLGVRILEQPAEGLLRQAVAAQALVPAGRTVRPGELAGRLVIEGPLASGLITWEAVAGDNLPGYYRYLRNNQRVYAVRTAAGWLEMDYRWAVWCAAPSATSCIWYLPRKRRLFLPTTVRPPLELERALVLRTGRLPERAPAPEVTRVSAEMHAYDNITHSFAAQIAQLLGKEVKLV
jgi:hypothetical protein